MVTDQKDATRQFLKLIENLTPEQLDGLLSMIKFLHSIGPAAAERVLDVLP